MFGSPALLDRVAQYSAERGFHLPTLRRVISAGAPVRADILKRFTPMLSPGAEVFTPYGATEALPVCSIGSDEILKETAAKTAQGQGICVGRPVKSIKVQLIRITDEPIPAWSDDLLVPNGAVGEIVVQGPVVTKKYFNRPESKVLAKIPAPHGEELYHRMGDLGRLDEQGRLWFYGRKSQRVVTSEETLFTIPCESIFNNHPLVRRTALVGVGEKGCSVPVLCVELGQNHTRAERIRIKAELLNLGASAAHTRSIKNVLFHSAFPVDIRHNAKIFREKLALWAARQLP
jgi:acyl-CoA synthetase (AMP-forming)/AMP-acid ligase II